MARLSIGTVALIGFLIFTAPASATQIVVEDGSPDYPYQRWVDSAAVPTPLGTVEIRERRGTRQGIAECGLVARACVFTAERVIYVDEWIDRDTFRHELAHIADADWLTDSDRAMFARIVHKRPWTAPYYDAPTGELFANTSTSCARQHRNTYNGRKRGERGGLIADSWLMPLRRYHKACRFIRATPTAP